MDGRHPGVQDASGDIHVGLIPALHAGMTESRSRTKTDRGPPPFLFSKETTKHTKGSDACESKLHVLANLVRAPKAP
jgi:hypothetical protein